MKCDNILYHSDWYNRNQPLLVSEGTHEHKASLGFLKEPYFFQNHYITNSKLFQIVTFNISTLVNVIVSFRGLMLV